MAQKKVCSLQAESTEIRDMHICVGCGNWGPVQESPPDGMNEEDLRVDGSCGLRPIV